MQGAYALLGPTATGKTGVALFLAERLNAEIISVDSRQIYRGMAVGSAAPDAEERARVPHHLVGEVDPAEGITAGDYGRRARAVAADILARGRTPLLVGGAGLYFRAILGGLDDELPRDPRLRERLRHVLKARGGAWYTRLARLDPVTASGFSARDGQRLSRAWELLLLTGRRPSELRTRGRPATAGVPSVVLHRQPEDLELRIRARVSAMEEAGLVGEVEALLARGLSAELPALKSVGYRETIAYLRGELDPDAWREAIVVNTRRYAKRQRTWFRSLTDARWLDIPSGEAPEATASRALPLFSPA